MVTCPVCKTTFTLEWLGIPKKVGTLATVVCVCSHQLEVTVHNPPRVVLGVPLGRKEIRVGLSRKG